jgi:NADPH:quinone reductase-like Zn-dependent oxidoreductase
VVVDPSLDYDWYDGQEQGPGFESHPLRLLGEHAQGGFAEYAVVPAANLLALPELVSFETAAAAGLVFVTAWRGLMTRGHLRAGERVLITGASGGVSTAAIQIAKLAGAEVFAVTSGAQNVERVRALGADRVYDRKKVEDFSREIWRDTGKKGVHVALDAVGEAVWPQCLKALGVRGRLVSYGATTGARGITEIRVLFWKQLSILGSTMGSPAEFREVMRLVFSGALHPVIHEVLPLAEAAQAHEMLEAGSVFGKLVLVP